MTTRTLLGCLLAVAICICWGCGENLSAEGDKVSGTTEVAAPHDDHGDHDHDEGFPKLSRAIAVVHPTQGNTAYGTVRFSQDGDKVTIVTDINGLKPNSKHAFHIHEFGDCSASDAESAGGHYNPEGHDHAGPEDSERHAGDLGNLETNDQGTAHHELVVDNITISGAKNPVLGRSIIIHAGEDDLTSQPSGNAGPRIGCGVIGVAKESP